MFTTMHFPVHRDEGPVLPAFNPQLFHGSPATTPSPYRPTISSPLSSSPIRASTPPSPSQSAPAVSPSRSSPSSGANAARDVQSSPAASAPKPMFKFASRGTQKPNPLTSQKREAAQESRRKLFLKNVRQRAEDKRWEKRGGEQELLKLEWSSLNRDLEQARNADLDGVVFESDIEDAARLREEVMRKSPRSLLEAIPEVSASLEAGVDADAMMVDMFEQEQAAEFEALMSSMAARQQQRQQGSSGPPGSPHWSDDEDYDALFMDYLSQEQQSQEEPPISSGDMDLS